MVSSINQALTHMYEFEHFIYENKQGFDDINQKLRSISSNLMNMCSRMILNDLTAKSTLWL